jgi:hypothetical protein
MPGNLNAGIAASRGDFVAVCHDHDLYDAGFIEMMLGTLERNPTALYVHCAIRAVDLKGALVQTHIGDWPELTPGSAWLKYMLRSLNCPVCALTMVRREVHERYGLYDTSCGFISDVEMWMRLSNRGDVAYVRQPLVSVRAREPNHPGTWNGGQWIRIAANIHRRFLPFAYSPKERVLKRGSLELRFLHQYLRHHASIRMRQIIAPSS